MSLTTEMECRPAISVITTVADQQSQWLTQSILSVAAQTREVLEFIIVAPPGDPCWDEVPTLNAHLGGFLKSVISDRPEPYHQAALGMKQARGDLIALIGSDDFYLPCKLEIESAMLERDPEAVLAHSAFFYTDERLALRGKFVMDDFNPKWLKNRCVVSEPALVRKSAWEAIGWLDESFEYACFWDAWLRMFERWPEGFRYDPAPTWLYRQHDAQVSRREMHTTHQQELRMKAVSEHYRRIGKPLPPGELTINSLKVGKA